MSQRDAFGNAIDQSVSYARGEILRSSAEEALRMLNGRRLVRERILRHGKDAIFNLTALTRSFPIDEADVQRLDNQFTYYAHFDREVEDRVLCFLGGDPARHDAFVLNRISAAMIAIMCGLLKPGDTFLSVVPRGRSHPSMERGARMARARFAEAYGPDGAAEALANRPKPQLAAVTPITHAKHHIDFADLVRTVELLAEAGVPVFLDDAHVSARMAVYEEPPSFKVGPIDLAIFSPDKHMVGPRAGALAGRKDLIRTVRGFSFEHGLEAQTSHAAAVRRAIDRYDPAPVAAAGRLARELLARLRERYGEDRVYPAGPGIGMSEETLLTLARERARGQNLTVVPIEASSAVCMHLLEKYGIATIPSLGMPGSSPSFRIMLYPDGDRFGIDGIVAAIEDGIDFLAAHLDDPDAVADRVLGPLRPDRQGGRDGRGRRVSSAAPAA